MRFGFRTYPGDKVSNALNSGRKVTVIGAASNTVSGGYRIITWNGDGKLIVAGAPLRVEYLVVGGGGAGGSASGTAAAARLAGGGGGAGGYVTNMGGALLTIPAGTHEIIVGAGGTSAGGSTVMGGAIDTNGQPSMLGGLIYAHGGGCGGRSSELVYLGTTFDIKFEGGQGGSNGGRCSIYGEEDNYVLRPVQGNSGGTADGTTTNIRTFNGGGGGGSGAKGGNATSTAGGAGGAGTSNSITGTAVTYAGGGGGGSDTSGGGGAGGSGGGGAGGYNANGSAGTANTGSGGGGAGSTTSNTEYKFGGAGGSGVVIIRYAV